MPPFALLRSSCAPVPLVALLYHPVHCHSMYCHRHIPRLALSLLHPLHGRSVAVVGGHQRHTPCPLASPMTIPPNPEVGPTALANRPHYYQLPWGRRRPPLFPPRPAG